MKTTTNLSRRIAALVLGVLVLTTAAFAADTSSADNFYKSDAVTAEKVTFKNQYNLKVAGNLYVPKSNQKVKWPASLWAIPWAR